VVLSDLVTVLNLKSYAINGVTELHVEVKNNRILLWLMWFQSEVL